jgi:hypothetical protein
MMRELLSTPEYLHTPNLPVRHRDIELSSKVSAGTSFCLPFRGPEIDSSAGLGGYDRLRSLLAAMTRSESSEHPAPSPSVIATLTGSDESSLEVRTGEQLVSVLRGRSLRTATPNERPATRVIGGAVRATS